MGTTAKKNVELLIELSKAYKAVQFYPEEHPALTAAIRSAIECIKTNAGDGDDISFLVTRSAFEYNGEVVGKNNNSFALFAKEFFSRNISTIFFMKDVTDEEMTNFFQILSQDPKSIRKAGGIEAALL